MPTLTSRVAPLILDELQRGERRVLSLTVAVRKALERTGAAKGDLTGSINSALRNLVDAKRILNTEGIYSLAPRHQTIGASETGNGQRALPVAERTPVPRRTKSREGRNQAATRRNSLKVEQYLTDVEKAHGCARAWALRERLEHGHVTLEELRGR
jgi:hypothetical protein